MTFGQRIKQLREKKRFSQLEVARHLEINNKTLSDYERGITQPDITTIKKIASFFEVSTDYLLGYSYNVLDSNSKVNLIPEQQELIQKIKEIRDPMTLAMINGYTDAITAQIKQNRKDAI